MDNIPIDNSNALIEEVIVVSIIILQVIVALFTLFKIRKLGKLFDNNATLSIVKIDNRKGEFINQIKYLESTSSNNSLANNLSSIGLSKFANYFSYSNPFKKIIQSLNAYLERNNTGATDFNLIKDVVERNTNSLEEGINLTISVPLYLGLMGTMTGIVVGLFNMYDIQNVVSDENLGSGINILLGGVKIAMISSLSGLALTVLNSGLFFRLAKNKLEEEKNDFYTFIQTELLPVVNQSLNATFDSLQRNLLKFNSEFTINLNRLGGLFDINYEALKAQKATMDMLKEIDLEKTAKYNVQVFKQLHVSMEEFEKFNQYLASINAFVNKVNYLIKRTENFESIAGGIDKRLAESHQLMEFIQSHFKALDDRKKIIQHTVINVDDAISEAINNLKAHTQNSIEKVKKFTIDETEALKSALSDSRTNLSNLAYLENLKKDVSLFKDSSAIQGEKVKQELAGLNENIDRLYEVLEEINNRQKHNFFRRLYDKYAKTREN